MPGDGMSSKPIVVGVDGSESGRRAVRWALDEAAHLATPVCLTRAFEWPQAATPVVPIASGWPDVDARRDAQRALDSAVVEATSACPGVQVHGEIRAGLAADVLRERSAEASMVVLGERGHGGFHELLVGSTSNEVASHAACPVVVVRGPEPDPARKPAPIVVGVDGSDCSLLALDFALRQADATGSELRVISAWAPPPGDGRPPDVDAGVIAESARRTLRERVAGPHARYPDVAVTEEFLFEQPVPALIGASDDARLLVVGSRGHGGFTGLLLGSVSQQLLHHAVCPVAVVREEQPAG
jgi:nucleotide-binding universal stress UspA family protein